MKIHVILYSDPLSILLIRIRMQLTSSPRNYVLSAINISSVVHIL